MLFLEEELKRAQNANYRTTRRPDFDDFWNTAVEKVKHHDAKTIMEQYKTPFKNIRVFDTTIHGLDGTPVKAWTILPGDKPSPGKVPAVVYFHGGEGSRGNFTEPYMLCALAGFAVVVPDFRMQRGDTATNTPMHMCYGKSYANCNLDKTPAEHYFYHAFTDQLIVVDFAMSLDEVDPQKVAVLGASQGGGTSMIMSALNHRIAACIAMVPSYCCWERRIFTRTACADEIAKYIQSYPHMTEQVFHILSYFDVVNFADKIVCPVEMQISLMDEAAPADCAFSAYNRVQAPKNVVVSLMGKHCNIDSIRSLWDLKKHLDK